MSVTFRSTLAAAAVALALHAAAPAAAPAARDAVISDAPYPGTVTLAVDLRDVAHRIFRVKESIPVAPGPVTLQFAQWIPGEHGPNGPLENVTGLMLSADGQSLAWKRDLVDMYSVRTEVPPGARSLEVSFQFLSPSGGHNFGEGASVTPDLAVLEWNQALLYPAGYAARQVPFQASLQLPADWEWATALETAPDKAADKSTIAFAPVSLETLVDSPVIAGRYFRRITLSTDPVPVRLDLAADRPANLAMSEEQIHQHERMVKEAAALFGARHYAHYDFLFALSDHVAHFGLEHHQSSDDRLGAEFFTDRDEYLSAAGLLSHEYVHSWNGKFRRPAGLLTANFSVPMHGDLLWVYEGLTTYWGTVLAARTGMLNADQFRDYLAHSAAALDHVAGRSWRPLQDTADEAQVLYNTPRRWQSWRRRTDFYAEGELVWLDVDTLIMELSHGERSLDDFAHAFFGRDDGQVEPRPYTFDDVVAALDRVQHYDWAHFLRTRLDAKDPHAPIDGIVRGGWKLAYTDEPSALTKADDKARHEQDLTNGLGLAIGHGDGADTIKDVIWGSAAFEAGLAPGLQLLAVNGTHYTPEVLVAAIKAAETGNAPIELLVRDDDQYRTVKADYHGGLRYPHLVRIDGTDERLGNIGKAHAK